MIIRITTACLLMVFETSYASSIKSSNESETKFIRVTAVDHDLNPLPDIRSLTAPEVYGLSFEICDGLNPQDIICAQLGNHKVYDKERIFNFRHKEVKKGNAVLVLDAIVLLSATAFIITGKFWLNKLSSISGTQASYFGTKHSWWELWKNRKNKAATAGMKARNASSKIARKNIRVNNLLGKKWAPVAIAAGGSMLLFSGIEKFVGSFLPQTFWQRAKSLGDEQLFSGAAVSEDIYTFMTQLEALLERVQP